MCINWGVYAYRLGGVWLAEFKRESGVQVERTQIERLAKPQMDINGGFIDLNVVISKLCLPAWQR